jgi:AsmA family
MSKRRRWILLPLAALAAILIVVLLLFDWNWLKGPLEGAVSAALERKFEVAGLDVELGTPPTITLQQARIANAPWGSRPDMLTVRQVRFAIELWPLLRGEIRLPFLQVQEPDLLVETSRVLPTGSLASRTSRRLRRSSRSFAISKSRRLRSATMRLGARRTWWRHFRPSMARSPARASS